MTRLFVSLYLGTLGTIFAFFYIAHLINTDMIIDVENIIEAEAFSAEVELVEQLDAYVGKETEQLLLQKLQTETNFSLNKSNQKQFPLIF